MLALGLLAWTGYGLYEEQRKARLICAFAREPESFTERWRVGSRDWRKLASFTTWIARTVPEGSVVAFRDLRGDPKVAWLAAAMLPRHDVLALERAAQLPHAAFLAHYRNPKRRRDLELLLEHADGYLYRLPAAAAVGDTPGERAP